MIAKTTEHHSCQNFVDHYLREIVRQLDLCHNELLSQSQSCPSIFLPLDILDHRLHDFVSLQRKYLLQKYDEQLARYKDVIQKKDLFHNLLEHHIRVDQVLKASR